MDRGQLHELITQFDGKIFREDKSSDTDIIVPPENITRLLYSLATYGFTYKKNINGTYEAFFFGEDAQLLSLDIISDFSYLGYYLGVFPKVNIETYLNNPNYREKIDVIRYILLFRNDAKGKELIYKNILSLQEIFQESFGEFSPFSKYPTNNAEVGDLLGRSIQVLFSHLRLKAFLNYMLARLKEIISLVFSGKIICLEGPDGSGKTTLAQKLLEVLGWRGRYVYMGNKGGALDALIYPMKERGVIYKTLANIGIYFVFVWSYIKLLILVAKGKTVIVDRWPTYKYYVLSKENRLITPFYLLYRFCFPKPHKVIIIEVSAETIMMRKSELTKKEIEDIYTYYNDILPHAIKVNNQGSIGDTLNSILPHIL